MNLDCIPSLLRTEVRVPVATYRAQMHKDFTFDQATAILPYLQRLGMGDFYASPIFEARPGSTHGYDVARHDRLNPELGGRPRFDILANALRDHGMGLLLDIVPNHMGIGGDAVWWQDVLQNGHASRYSSYFDIDWTPLKHEMRHKLLLPILGNQYGEDLEAKHIQVTFDQGRFFVTYFEHRMPVAPRSVPMIFFRRPIGTLPSEQEVEGMPHELADLLRELTHVPPHETTDPTLQEQRQEQLGRLMPRLRETLQDERVRPSIDAALARLNGVSGDPHSFDALDEFLNVQPYRLAYWRTSAEEINYRRFFDVNDLVGLRMETPEVFADTHCLIRDLLARQQVTGLRIDHCDGMFNPRQYLIRLQLLYLASQCAGPQASGDTAATGIERVVLDKVRGYDWTASHGPLYVVVEKILEPREYMPREWPVHGTSGYDFVYFANNIFIQRENAKAFDRLYERVLGRPMNPDEVIYRSKLQVMQNSLASEVHVLTNMLSKIAAADRHARDFTDNILEAVLRETIACFPVYRTYIDERGTYPERDIAFIMSAIRQAKRRNPDVDASAFDFLRDMLLLRRNQRSDGSRNLDPQQLHFALKFQQLTGPVMAKGVEDTTFYVYTRFLSSNEVGGDTKSFGIPLDLWHASNQERLEVSPDSMLTTSTHDTKRSEDVRNRLNVLSEIPDQWAAAIRRWQRVNATLKQTLPDGRVAPDANEEYLLYQTIVGAWPWRADEPGCRESLLERLQQYATKALSEAKVNLSWVNPDAEYVEAVHGFLARILLPDAQGRETAFVQTLNRLLPQVRFFGGVNSIAQVVLKATSPGVPDFYQGTELWDLSLVDPDNRRPVDYTLRDRLLAQLDEMAAQEGPAAVARAVTADLSEGAIKLWTTAQVLRLRQTQHGLFRRGTYVPLVAEGSAEPHLIAHARQLDQARILAAVPRFACSLMRGDVSLPLGRAWRDWTVTVPENLHGRYRNIFTGETVEVTGELSLSTLFANYPVAVLADEGRATTAS